MNDFIKRQEVIEVIHKFFREKVDYICGERKEVPFDEIDHILECNKELSSAIKEIPTAFDVGAVVKELEELRKITDVPMIHSYCNTTISKAIEIVRKGGVK